MQSNMNVIMVWESMLWSLYGVASLVRAWMLCSPSGVEHERYSGLGRDALVIVCLLDV